MSASHRLLPGFKGNFTLSLNPRNFAFSCSSTFLHSPPVGAPRSPGLYISPSGLFMPRNQSRGDYREKRWQERPQYHPQSSCTKDTLPETADTVTNKLSSLYIAGNVQHARFQVPNVHSGSLVPPDRSIIKAWRPKSYGSASSTTAQAENQSAEQLGGDIKENGGKAAAAERIDAVSNKVADVSLSENFTVDDSSCSRAQIRATFYPKFENEKSDQEIRTRMTEMVSKGLATLEVSLKHSGSLFMYAGHEGGAYAKNSFGNVYTAVGVFVLARMFREAWHMGAAKKQLEFNNYLERNNMCISMELVTAVLGDHGQRPLDDYVVVTAVTELGNKKPKFYSTPELIAFCRKWRLPTNHVWLFSTRKSAMSFFAAYDALCEEGTATPVCKALDEVADVSVPGTKDHTMVQGEILEGLVARIVSCESSEHMKNVLKDFPLQSEGVATDLGPSLREICSANRADEKQQIKALLESVSSSFCPDYVDWFGRDGSDVKSRNADRSVISKFLQAHPADFCTAKLQEMVRLMRDRRLPAAIKCYYNFHKLDSLSNDDLYFKMVIHVRSDSAFRRYQKEMRYKPGLWPLYRGFFVDVNLFKASKKKAVEMAESSNGLPNNVNDSNNASAESGLADEDANLMVKLKFLTYKLRTFLIRNGLSILFKEGPAAYKAYYLRQMKIWGTSAAKQRELSRMLDEWAVYIRKKFGRKQLSSSTYLSEAEPFLEQYAKRSLHNQALVGSAGNVVKTEDFLAVIEDGRDEEGDLETEKELVPSIHTTPAKETVRKVEGLIVFFPGIPGCAKSALCKELMNTPGGLGDDRPLCSLMGDLVKGRYWQKVSDERMRKPYSIMLADKNAPNEEVWRQIEDMCRRTRASSVPVIPDSEGTDSNPFSLDALAVFMFRVLQRTNHPGNLDGASPNVGYVLLMFYHLYSGKSRKEFEGELVDRFGSVVKMPLLKPDRSPLLDVLKFTLEEGINLYSLHTNRHGRMESTKGFYAAEWAKWERKLRETLFGNAEYLNFIQVPFKDCVSQTLEQLRSIAKGDYTAPTTEKRKLGSIVFAAVSVPVREILGILDKLSASSPEVHSFLMDKHLENTLSKAHVTLAHKRAHGVAAVACYGVFAHQKVPVSLTAFFLSEKLAAFEAALGTIDGEQVSSRNEWPHLTLWTADGVAPKEANTLPQLHSEGKATRVELKPPVAASGTVEFF